MVRRTKRDAVATRNGLLDAAERVFHDKGVARASLGDIAQASGATRGAIYWHFKDKADLFNAMMDRVTLPLESAYAAGQAQLPPLQRLRDVVQRVLRMVVSDERTRRVLEIAMYKVEYVAELSAVRDRHIHACEDFRRKLADDLIAAAHAQGLALRLPIDAAAMGLWALFDGLLQGWLLERGGFDLVAVGAVTVDSYLTGLGLDVAGG